MMSSSTMRSNISSNVYIVDNLKLSNEHNWEGPRDHLRKI